MKSIIDKFARIKPLLTPPVFDNDSMNRQASLLNTILYICIGLDLLTILMISLAAQFKYLLTPIILGVILWGLVAVMRAGYLQLASVIFTLSILLATTYNIFYYGGVHSSLISGYFVLVVVSGLFFDRKAVVTYTFLSIFILSAITYGDVNGFIITPSPDNQVIELIQVVLTLTVVALVVFLAINNLEKTFAQLRTNENILAEKNTELQKIRTSLEDYVAEIKETEGELRQIRDELEERVKQRTFELANANAILQQQIAEREGLEGRVQQSLIHRAKQVETSTEVAQRIAAAPALDDLFRRVVNLVQERFGYYHAHVYTLEDNNLVMQEGTGIAGRMMKEAKHKIALRATRSLVARAARTGKPILVSHVRDEPDWLPNALLPETKSEIAVPIKLGDEILGVLDVQNDKVGSLKAEDQILLMGLCGQIAVAINNRRLEAQRKQAEEGLKRYAGELERSNKELQDFAFVASHDLQEPLRKIRTFGDRLQQKYEDALDKRGQDYLLRMQNAAARMQTLINDLLTYSRITSKAQPFVSVDLLKVAQEVVSDLEVSIEQVKGVVKLDDLPTIEADPTQIRQLIQNLIGNALKFHRLDVTPIVEVTATVLETETDSSPVCQITVSDNGIGFDEKYIDRIFGVFQRLHARSVYEGTGVGLAVCRKIIERHGGTITAKSTPEQGASFIITLPVNQPPGGAE